MANEGMKGSESGARNAMADEGSCVAKDCKTWNRFEHSNQSFVAKDCNTDSNIRIKTWNRFEHSNQNLEPIRTFEPKPGTDSNIRTKTWNRFKPVFRGERRRGSNLFQRLVALSTSRLRNAKVRKGCDEYNVIRMYFPPVRHSMNEVLYVI